MEFFIKLVSFLLVFIGFSARFTTVSYKISNKSVYSSTEVMVKDSQDIK